MIIRASICKKKALEDYGSQVDVVNDDSQAIALFNGGYDAIVLDFNLPDMTGLEISKAIRAHRFKSH
jgi:DNA-binding response OmpR family regulator